MGVKSVLKFVESTHRIGGLPHGPEHRDTVEAQFAARGKARGIDPPERDHFRVTRQRERGAKISSGQFLRRPVTRF
jgi:hypothetical protein